MIHDRKFLFDTVRPLFGHFSQPQIEGLDAILDALEKESFNREEEAYILATAFHESAHTMQPVRETLATSDDQAILRLESSWKAGKLPWVKTPYWRKDAEGKSWFGRGLVQITFRYNYVKLGAAIGEDLVTDPNRALDDEVAIKILIVGMRDGLFTGSKLSSYIDGLDESDAEDYREFLNARRIVNGIDRAALIAGYAITFEHGLSK